MLAFILAQGTVGFDTRQLMFELGVLEYWPVLLVVLTALGTWAYAHVAVTFYCERAKELTDTLRGVMKENRELRAKVKRLEEDKSVIAGERTMLLRRLQIAGNEIDE